MESHQYPQGELLITGWCEAVQSPGSPASSSSILLVIKRLLACKGQDLKEHLQIKSHWAWSYTLVSWTFRTVYLVDACDKPWSFGGQTLLLTVSCYRAAWHKKRGLCPSSHTWFFSTKNAQYKNTGVSKRNSSAQMLMTSHLWCFPHNSWGRGPPCRWACHSSTQHPCAWWRGYSRPVERTALPLSSLHNHTEPPPTPRQSETPTKKEQNTQMFSAPAENLTITKLLYILLKTQGQIAWPTLSGFIIVLVLVTWAGLPASGCMLGEAAAIPVWTKLNQGTNRKFCGHILWQSSIMYWCAINNSILLPLRRLVSAFLYYFFYWAGVCIIHVNALL